ncbi:hypothetical protein [Rhodopseudomonas sp. BR0M22]|uniref:hypothetical protein n=1 Tax=Rhodopseudomonas sp. BR0M22 TaxID=2269369 RepID=UPI0013DF117E|nr:hypothetical protein [Rhodopseudomonas sp. BR0M22]NEW93153.1 hypothetical protein [Rhodopseudomonas sp. BR0M22]
MILKLSRLSLLVAASALVVGIQSEARSQTAAPAARRERPAPVAQAAPAATPSAPTRVDAGSEADVDGFRSAKFGMNEAEVKAAITRDFGVKPDAIKEQANPGERTKVLIVKVPEVLPGGGTAEVSYVIGYQTKKLIQVSLSWSKATDDKMTPEQLFSNSSVLRSHFVGEGFKPDTIATNMPIAGGLLMFRGSDAKDRTVMMILQGAMTQGTDNQRILTPSNLLLFYIADAKAPDVYRLPAGSF